jgi:hypothetical protein
VPAVLPVFVVPVLAVVSFESLPPPQAVNMAAIVAVRIICWSFIGVFSLGCATGVAQTAQQQTQATRQALEQQLV